MDKKWRVLSSEIVLRDRWINLRADHCVTPSGVDIDPYYVLTYPDWVHVVAITPDDQLVLVRQYRHAANSFILELPGGISDPSDADMAVTARRELAEETGYVSNRWQFVSALHVNAGTHTNKVHFFLALDALCERPQALDAGEEGLSAELMPIPEVLAGLSSGLIGQSMHVGGLLLGLAAAGRLKLTAGCV